MKQSCYLSRAQASLLKKRLDQLCVEKFAISIEWSWAALTHVCGVQQHRPQSPLPSRRCGCRPVNVSVQCGLNGTLMRRTGLVFTAAPRCVEFGVGRPESSSAAGLNPTPFTSHGNEERVEAETRFLLSRRPAGCPLRSHTGQPAFSRNISASYSSRTRWTEISRRQIRHFFTIKIDRFLLGPSK